jgi:hypothetical protein
MCASLRSNSSHCNLASCICMHVTSNPTVCPCVCCLHLLALAVSHTVAVVAGGSPARVEAARAIVEAGVAVMGHVGLTPQSVSVLGEHARNIDSRGHM